jgi:predicted nucleic acid-binding Zn ribbon protein
MVGDDKCLWCGGPAHGVNFHKTFCSTKCKNKFHVKKKRKDLKLKAKD